MEYTVIWSIELEAGSSLEAAKMAREVQLDPDSLATHFIVMDAFGESRSVDLAEGDNE